MPPRKEMVGKTFGELHVIGEAGIYEAPGGSSRCLTWLCRCACGKECVVRGVYLRTGHTKTCGHCQVYVDNGDYMRCTLKDGRTFIFDADDYDIVRCHRWSVDSAGYVTAGTKHGQKKLHREFMHPGDDEVVDHINADPADCRRANLRVVKQRENAFNQSLPRTSTTGYKGVCFEKRYKKYLAHIHPNRKTKCLGYYNTPEEAAIAYNEAALRYFGEYARINVVGQPFTTISAHELDRGEEPIVANY